MDSGGGSEGFMSSVNEVCGSFFIQLHNMLAWDKWACWTLVYQSDGVRGHSTDARIKMHDRCRVASGPASSSCNQLH